MKRFGNLMIGAVMTFGAAFATIAPAAAHGSYGGSRTASAYAAQGYSTAVVQPYSHGDVSGNRAFDHGRRFAGRDEHDRMWMHGGRGSDSRGNRDFYRR